MILSNGWIQVGGDPKCFVIDIAPLLVVFLHILSKLYNYALYKLINLSNLSNLLTKVQ